MGSYCSSINRHFVYLPEIDEEKKHGKTKTILNKDGKLRVYSRKNRSKSLSEIIDKKDMDHLNKKLRRRYTEYYNEKDNNHLIDKSLMFKLVKKNNL